MIPHITAGIYNFLIRLSHTYVTSRQPLPGMPAIGGPVGYVATLVNKKRERGAPHGCPFLFLLACSHERMPCGIPVWASDGDAGTIAACAKTGTVMHASPPIRKSMPCHGRPGHVPKACARDWGMHGKKRKGRLPAPLQHRHLFLSNPFQVHAPSK